MATSPIASKARSLSLPCRHFVVVCVALALSTTATCVSASAAPASGQVEEWTVPTVARWSQLELGAGPEGNVWFLQGVAGYYDDTGTVQGISPSGFGVELAFDERALGVDVAPGPDGNMWITEPHWGEETEEPDTIGRLEVHGGEVHMQEFKIEDTELSRSCCLGPLAIVSGPGGDLWFTDRRPDNQHEVFIGQMETDGHLVAQHPIPSGTGLHRSAAPAPDDIAVGAEGAIWFTDDGTNERGQNLVGRLDSAGEAEEFPIPAVGAEPAAIALGSDGAMWFTEPGKSRIGRVTSTGEIKEFAVPDVTSALKGLALAPEGDLWFAERQSQPGFGSISPTGEVRSYHPVFEPYGEGDGFAAVIGPDALVLGPDGDLWFTDPRPRDEFDPDPTTDEGRFAIPLPPQNTQLPVVQGSLTVGAVLSASGGSWSHEQTAESYQWQRCSSTSASCQNIEGETASSHLLSAADAGSHIRAVVTASNEAGITAAASEMTAAVQPTAEQHNEIQKYQPEVVEVVGATIASLLARSHHGVTIHAMVLHGVTAGSTVAVTCRGVGCALAHAAHSGKPSPCNRGICKWVEHVTRGPAVTLTSLMRPMRLQYGARLTVVVTYPGWVGRAFEFQVGRRGVPSPVLTCRARGSIETTSRC
jgi:virginiamycin B lyase